MTRIPLLVLAGLVAAAASHGAHPLTVATPQPNADSLAAAQRAHAESLQAAARARADEERLAEAHRADSLAALNRTSEILKQTVAEKIHFAFDKAYIRPGDAETLDRKIPVLQANPALRIEVAGNCDERGSDEYNLALGNRRALAAKQYLVNHGIDGSRVTTVSYGKERPLDPGHNEEAWARNRNDQFDILTANVVLRQR